ncbi:hypothetical protein [Haladaptatus halobius]|uniref:hypothetical protein n=1 Tax=Haladaptatus halobius TaxID=2884875 RepID=UPI001D09B649|nr:hypothetical protein [Haladaptatus halobius]
MRVTNFEVIPVAHREPRLRNSWGGHSDIAARTLVRLTTADSEVGLGETYGDQREAMNRVRNLVEGMNPFERKPLDRQKYEESDPLAYSSVESMATEYAEAMDDIGRSNWLPNKPRW